MNESHNFFKRKFREFFMENHPDHVCSFPSREEYNDWVDKIYDGYSTGFCEKQWQLMKKPR